MDDGERVRFVLDVELFGVADVVAVDLIRERLRTPHDQAVQVVPVVDAAAPGKEPARPHGRRRTTEPLARDEQESGGGHCPPSRGGVKCLSRGRW